MRAVPCRAASRRISVCCVSSVLNSTRASRVSRMIWPTATSGRSLVHAVTPPTTSVKSTQATKPHPRASRSASPTSRSRRRIPRAEMFTREVTRLPVLTRSLAIGSVQLTAPDGFSAGSSRSTSSTASRYARLSSSAPYASTIRCTSL
jgi:hypothetical protein